MKNDEVVYQLTVEDLQSVAEQTLERRINDDEIKIVREILGDYIPWFESIEFAISSKIRKVENYER